MSKFYLTTPLYYVNASPHIGHAYTTVIADCMARWRRLKGEEVFFLTGTDEHGEKIKKAAENSGKEVKPFVDETVENFKSLWRKLDVSYDLFLRTTDSYHETAVKKVITTLAKKGDIYKANYQAYHCIPCESFWTEIQLGGKKICPDCGREVSKINEENYFFKLSQYENWLRDYLKANPDCILPKTRFNEVMGFLENNKLEDLCISRPKSRVSWGIDFPLDEKYVVYVWFDALLNYISGIGFSSDEKKFKKFWPADIHFMAKDILRYHAVFWPIMLKALGLEPPRLVFAHGWWKFEGEKMSKSRGNIVNPLEVVEKFGVDALRYFLLREIPIGVDGNFFLKPLINRINSDLANDLGNLLYRVLNMSEKYFQGKVCSKGGSFPPEFEPFLKDNQLLKSYQEDMDSCQFSSGLEKLWSFIGAMNKYVEDKKPWVLFKEKRLDELEQFIWSLLEGIRIVAVLVFPVMPQTSQAIFRQLGREFKPKEVKVWLKGDFTVKKEAPLFPRIDLEQHAD